MKTRVETLGAAGYVADTVPYSLPPHVWSTLQNMRCDGRVVETFKGYLNLDTINARADTLVHIATRETPLIVHAHGSEIYSWTNGAEVDISLRSYIGNGAWQSTVLGGVAILNNGEENPQYWGGAGLCADLPFNATCTWTEAEFKADVLRSFKNFVFALGVSVCGTYNPRRLIWGHPAEPGTVPTSWDITDPTNSAGDAFMSDTAGSILDGLPLKDAFIIYKEDAIHAATFTGDARGASYLWNFRLVSHEHGIYARDCVCDIGGGHVFIGDGDIFFFDGNRPVSICDGRVRDLFFDNVNREYYDRTFVSYYNRKSEVWICYPSVGSQWCDKALIWNHQKDVWSQRDLPDVSAATYAVLVTGSEYTWATLPYATWADWGIDPVTPAWTYWSAVVIPSPITDSLIMAGDASLLRMGIGETDDGSPLTCIAQRTHLDLGDATDWHMVTAIYPRATGDAFRVRVGSHDTINDTITWSGYQTFTPGTDYKVNFRVTGRLHAIEFSSAVEATWALQSYEVEYQMSGRR